MTPIRIKSLFFGLGFLLTILTLVLGPLPQRILPQDVFIMLTAAEKIDRGLVSYVDFENFLGPVPILPVVLGMKIVGIVPYALNIGQSITIPCIFGLTWFLFLRYQPNLPNLLVALYIALTWCTPTQLHRLFFSLSSAMYYDREGLSILSLLLMVSLGSFTYDAIWCGILLGILFYIKIPFAVCGIPLVLIAVFRRRENSIVVMSQLALGFILTLVVVAFYIGFYPLGSMILFIYKIGRIQDHDLLNLRSIQMRFDSVVFLAVVPIVISFIAKNVGIARQTYFELACVIATAVSSSFIDGPTLHLPDSPIAITYGLYLFGKVKIIDQRVFICFIALSIYFINDLLGYVRLVELKLLPKQELITGYVQSKGFEDFPLTGGFNIYKDKDIPIYISINDGLQLISRHPELKDKKIACLGFTDYFSLARHVASPDHMPVVLQSTMTVTTGSAPPAARLLSDCDGIIISKKVTIYEQGSTLFYEQSRDYINTHFPKKDESELWLLQYR